MLRDGTGRPRRNTIAQWAKPQFYLHRAGSACPGEPATAPERGTASVSINVGDLPEAAFARRHWGNRHQPINTSLDANSCAWSFGDGSTSAETEPAHLRPGWRRIIKLIFATNTCTATFDYLPGSDRHYQSRRRIFEMDATTGLRAFYCSGERPVQR